MVSKTIKMDRFIHFIYSIPICHRRHDRTFNFHGHYFPVCARCTGIYIGAILYLIYSLFFIFYYSNIVLLAALFIISPLIIDGLTQYLGFRESNNILRFSTGFAAGVGIILLFHFT